MFHCGEIKLSQCHSELVSGCQAGCTAKYPLLEARDKVKCLTEQVRNIPLFSSEGEAIQPIFNSKFVNESTSSQPSPQGEGASSYAECIGKKPCESLEILRLNPVDLSQSKGLSLRMTSLFDNSNQCRHPEQSEGFLTKGVGVNPSPQSSPLGEEVVGGLCHAELVSASLAGQLGEFPSPREEGLGERVLPFAMLAVDDIIKKCAFTLAEVLITLGIIGVVAAITIPILSTKVQVKVLENQFKKADAMFQQALKTTFQEAGYDSVRDLESTGDKGQKEAAQELEEINKIWISQFSGATTITNNRLYSQGVSHVYNILGGKYPNNYYFDSGLRTVYLLKNGMLVTSLRAEFDGGNLPVYITFKFDTNGPYKGPNRLGHDIFKYTSIGSNFSLTNMCNPTIQNSYQQEGCYAWASKNINPKDNTSPYWNILFKPKSYWGL